MAMILSIVETKVLSIEEKRWIIMTIENNDKPNADDAQQALITIRQMERISIQQSIPPRWFGIAMALMFGALVFTIAAGLRDYYVFPILAIPIIFAVRSKKTQALPRTTPLEGKGIVAIIAVIVFSLALIAGGRVFKEIYEMAWSPMVAGLIAAFTVYLLSIAERNEHLAKLNGE